MRCTIELIDPNTNKIVKTNYIESNYFGAENRAKELNDKMNKKGNNKALYWKVTAINS